MQHIIQVAFDFDDNKIRESIERNIENQIILNIERQMIKKDYFEYRYGPNPIDQIIREIVKGLIEQHEQEIIESVKNNMTKRLSAKKSFKEI